MTAAAEKVYAGRGISAQSSRPIRFVPPETGAIGVSATRDGPSVVLSVRDNGAGIPPEYQDAIFEMLSESIPSPVTASETPDSLSIS